MYRAIRKSLVLVLGVVAAIALGVPASAQAATAAAAAPNLHASDCASGPSPHNFQLEDWSSTYVAEIDPSSGNLYIGGGTPHDFCQALVGPGIVQIFTSSTNYCLAYNSTFDDAYAHAPTGCTSTAPPPYMQWKFIGRGTIDGDKVYNLQSVFSGTCVAGVGGELFVDFVSCTDPSVSIFLVNAI